MTFIWEAAFASVMVVVCRQAGWMLNRSISWADSCSRLSQDTNPDFVLKFRYSYFISLPSLLWSEKGSAFQSYDELTLLLLPLNSSRTFTNERDDEETGRRGRSRSSPPGFRNPTQR
jgi:hypothetical protein